MYDEAIRFVKESLAGNDVDATKLLPRPFRKRSEHCLRVYGWAKRLLEDQEQAEVDKDAVLTAALFHDVGYAVSTDSSKHAAGSKVLFDRYAVETAMDPIRKTFISYLVENHSKKELLDGSDAPAELILLMEADLLDETGAMAIVWDCLVEGMGSNPDYLDTYRHIQSYSGKLLVENPMVHRKARALWAEKQALIRGFIDSLALDLHFTD